MKKLIFWGAIFAMFVLGGGGAGAYISHANNVRQNTPANNTTNVKGQNSNSSAKNGKKNEQRKVGEFWFYII